MTFYNCFPQTSKNVHVCTVCLNFASTKYFLFNIKQVGFPLCPASYVQEGIAHLISNRYLFALQRIVPTAAVNVPQGSHLELQHVHLDHRLVNPHYEGAFNFSAIHWPERDILTLYFVLCGGCGFSSHRRQAVFSSTFISL